jgi:hypothetical protein
MTENENPALRRGLTFVHVGKANDSRQMAAK